MAQISSLQNFISDSLDSTHFKLIRKREDVDNNEISFHPEMAHQIFGENESIFGYRDLKVDIFYSAGPLDMYYKVNYSKRVDDLETEGIKADNIDEAISELVSDGCYYTNLEEFLNVCEKKSADFKPFGEKVDEFETTINSATPRHFEVYVCDMNAPGFLKFHARLESFSFWFIDAFSRLEHDPLWLYFVIYEKYQTSDNDTRYATVGYCTVYQYYSYPQNIRPRISQILILPPFQKLGIASRLIEKTLYDYFVPKENVTDITYEEPTDILQHIRSVIDTKRCRTLPSFAPDNLLKGFSKDMLKEAKAKFKITPKQVRVCYEILRFSITNLNNAKDYRDYRIEVKKRLNLNYSKHRRDLKKAEKRGVDVKTAMHGLPSIQERIAQLDAEYKEVEKVYHQVLRKVKL
uniref:Histone acetyltransferase type B catalytic subunit n=1 Tax=Corethrella appendiculata TaxID=1370023 RepID=U5EWV2_9DIPT